MRPNEVLWKSVEVVMVTILGVMVVLVFGNVVARYAFDAAITWAEEVSRFLFVWLTFVGASLGLRRGVHLSVDLVVAALSSRKRLALQILCHVISIVFFCVWAFGGLTLINANLDYMSPATGFSMGLVYVIGPLSAVLLSYESATRLVADLRLLRRKEVV